MIKEQEPPQEKRPPLPALSVNQDEGIVLLNGWVIKLRGHLIVSAERTIINYGHPLNAEIEFTEESLLPKKPKKEKGAYQVDLKEEQEEIMHALFSVNPQRTGFKNERLKDAITDIYKDKLSAGNEKDRKLLMKLYNAVVYARTISLIRIKRNWDKPPEQRLPKIGEFIKWLKEQPEYANATLEDLELAARRKISFAELKKKTAPAPVERQIFPQPSTMPMSIRSEPVQLYPARAVEENPPQSPPRRVVEKVITPLRITVGEPSMLFSVLTFEEIVDLAVNLLGINEQNPTLLRGIGIDPVECDKIRRLITSIKITLESKRRSIKPDGGIVLNGTPLTIKQKLDAFQKNPEAFLQANKVEARILLKYFANLEKEKLAVLLSALCPKGNPSTELRASPSAHSVNSGQTNPGKAGDKIELCQ